MPTGYSKGKIDIGWWQTQIEAGIEFRKTFAHVAKWPTWRQYYRGQWKGDILPANIYFKMIRTVVPRIYFRNPSVSLISTKPGLENMLLAQLLERIDNKLIRQMKLKKQMKKIVQDTFMFGTGVGKMGYGAQFTPSPTELDNTAPNKAGTNKVEYNQIVTPNMPWFLRTHPGAFLVPTGCMDFDDARFCIHYIRRPLLDVKADVRFDKTARAMLDSGSGNKGTMIASKPDDNKASKVFEEMVDLYEIRDKKNGTVSVIAPYNLTDKALYEGPDELQYNGRLPFHTITFNEDDEVFWGVPDSQILEPLQLELNENMTQIMKHRRLSLIKLLAKKNALNPDQAAKLLDKSILPYVEMDGDPLTDIKWVEGNNIPQDLFIAKQNTTMEVRETVGFSRNEFGEYKEGSGDTTATEAMIVRQASEIRVDERRDMMADMFVGIMEDVNHIIFNHWNEEQVVDIMGPNGVPVWVRFKPEMLKGLIFEYNVDPDTSVPETKKLRQQNAQIMFQQLNGDPLIDQLQLRRYFLHEHHGTVFDTMLKIPPGMPGSAQVPMDLNSVIQMFQQGKGPKGVPAPAAGG